MIFLTYRTSAGLKLGIKTEKGVVDVESVSTVVGLHDLPVTPWDFMQTGLLALPALHTLVAAAMAHPGVTFLQETELVLGPCVPDPGKIICIGLNYRRHAAESGMQPPATPVVFSKFGNTIAASHEDVPLLPNAEKYDYEAELVVVIGKAARAIPEADALDYVLGYCNGNDISARDLQMLTSQWLLGKTPDKFLPLGPYLVTADEIPNPQDLSIKCWLNGELRQNSNTGDMIFSVAQLVSYLSQYMTLEPGDIISTGTPEGVILGRPEKIWMKPGDEVTVEVGHLGRLTNRMVKG